MPPCCLHLTLQFRRSIAWFKEETPELTALLHKNKIMEWACGRSFGGLLLYLNSISHIRSFHIHRESMEWIPHGYRDTPVYHDPVTYVKRRYVGIERYISACFEDQCLIVTIRTSHPDPAKWSADACVCLQMLFWIRPHLCKKMFYMQGWFHGSPLVG